MKVFMVYRRPPKQTPQQNFNPNQDIIIFLPGGIQEGPFAALVLPFFGNLKF